MKNLFLYFSAFVPMYVLVLVKFLVGTLSQTIEITLLTVLTFLVFGLLTTFGILGLMWNMFYEKGQSTQIKIVSSTNITDQHFLTYFSLFVLYALSFELTKPSMLTISFIIIILIGIVYINNKMFYINPLLNILGYNFYEITYVTSDNPSKKKIIKIYCKGTLENKVYKANLKNENFAFIDK